MKLKLLRGALPFLFILISHLLTAQAVFINEIHYDNGGADVAEAVEIAGPAGTDLSGWTIELYNGNNSSYYGAIVLQGVLPNQQGGFGTAAFFYSGIQNGSPDGLALVNASGEVVQFLSYEGSFTALDGAAAGTTSTDINVFETGSEPEGYSLQLTGEGTRYEEFSWQSPSQNTFGALNTSQSFGGTIIDPEPEPEPEPELPPSPAVDVVFINEIHYDNYSTDSGEGIEIAGTAGTDLSQYKIVLYNGSGGAAYNTLSLEGIIPNQQNSYGTFEIKLPVNGLQNGSPDGIALVKGENVIQFLSYEGSFEAVDGLAAGLTSTDIGVAETSSTPAGYSLQLTGEGSAYNDFTWASEAAHTFGEVNTNQVFLAPEPVLFVNELHYDNEGTDTAEAIEVAGTAGLDLSGYSIVFYNGSNGETYKTLNLTGILPNLDGGYGTLEFFSSGIQNGSPDGFALVKGNEILQFLSYEGSFTALNGVAAGMTSTDIGVSENGVTTGFSLQLGGTGKNYEDFVWQEARANTFGAVNTGQSFGGEIVDPEPEPEPVEPGTIAYARNAAPGTKLVISGVLTATDHFGNTAYIQDGTAGIAIYGDLVTEENKFNIGDSIKVTGFRAVYNELVQISDLESVEYLGVANEPIEPKLISLSELEEHRGQLVTITDMNFPSPGQLFFGDSNYTVTDNSGEGELRIDSDVESLVGRTQPQVCGEVTGIVGRYREINQLLPRKLEDLPCAEVFNPVYPGSDISKSLTFDVATWNIEWFGDEENSPAAKQENSDEIQKEAVKAILLELNADIIAVNEISDELLFAQMISEMEGYDFILSNATSYPDSPGGQKIGFVFKTETVKVLNSQPLLTELHPYYNGGDYSLLQDYPDTADRFFASGRLPFLMEAEITMDGQTQIVKFIALHARANGSSGSQLRYDMRKYDVEKLKEYIDAHFAEDHVVLLGDYNEDLDVTVADVSTTISSFVSYTSDDESYSFPTLALSESGYRSYVVGDYDDMIDHIMITNEFDDNYIEGSARVHYEFYSSDYTYTTSDHFPVSIRLVLSELKIGSINTNGTICSEGDTTSATVIAEGGIAPYTYLWSDGQETETATGLQEGTYVVEVTDALGYTVTSEINIKQADPVIIGMIEDQTVFLGYGTNCTSLSAVSINGGSGEYTYLWSNGATSEVVEVCPSETTQYKLLVTDAITGCTSEAYVTVNVLDVSCGKKQDKVMVCHNGNSICIAPEAVPAHLRKGAVLGSCDDSSAELVVEEIVASPNPAAGFTNLRITATSDLSGTIAVYNLGGTVLHAEKLNLQKGLTDHQLMLHKLSPGIYVIKVLAVGYESPGLKLIKN